MRGHVGRIVACMTVIVGLWLTGAVHTPAVAQSGGAPAELRVAWWGSQDRHNRTIKAIELFQKKHPPSRSPTSSPGGATTGPR